MCADLTTDFPDDVVQALRTAGWRTGRRLPIQRWITSLESQGFECFPLAHDFLQSFGGLTFNEQLREDSAFSPGRTRLDPFLAASGEFDRISDWEQMHGLRLFPVGNCFGDYFILMISPDEKFFAGSYDDDLVAVANNSRECFEQLLYAPRGLVTLHEA